MTVDSTIELSLRREDVDRLRPRSKELKASLIGRELHHGDNVLFGGVLLQVTAVDPDIAVIEPNTRVRMHLATQAMQLRCSECHTESAVGNEFCGSCGHRLPVIDLSAPLGTTPIVASSSMTPTPAVAGAPAGGGGDAVEAEEQSEFDVILTGAGQQKIQVVKVVKDLLGVGLKEAKHLVDGAPGPIMKKAGKGDAVAARAVLKEVGAHVELKRSNEHNQFGVVTPPGGLSPGSAHSQEVSGDRTPSASQHPDVRSPTPSIPPTTTKRPVKRMGTAAKAVLIGPLVALVGLMMPWNDQYLGISGNAFEKNLPWMFTGLSDESEGSFAHGWLLLMGALILVSAGLKLVVADPRVVGAKVVQAARMAWTVSVLALALLAGNLLWFQFRFELAFNPGPGFIVALIGFMIAAVGAHMARRSDSTSTGPP